MASDPQIAAHKAWLGFLQPVGLVVSPPALVKAQAVLSANVVDLQQSLLGVVTKPKEDDPEVDKGPYLDDFPRFTEQILGWQQTDLAGGPDGPEIPEDLEVVLTDYGETLKPTYAAVDSAEGTKVLMLVQVVSKDIDLDEPIAEGEKRGWQASPQAKFERLLREKEIPAGLLSNGYELRLVYAPKGETSGHLTFPIKAMCEVTGRQILAAMQMLLDEHRVFGALEGRRLNDLLAESRKYQNEVSTKLSDQVLGALWELLRGFQAADEASGGQILRDLSQEDPQHIYGGLLTVLLRTVFLLYAEDQGLMPDDPVYVNNYSVTGLYARLREDAGRYPDTMDQRYGAWTWMLTLFRLVFDGGGHGKFHLPTRHGQLFNPDEYPFLEGRPKGVMRVMGDQIEAPKVSDGCIYRVLEGLLILDGERLSYRALDVEQIGSVYEAMMGFAVERARGRSIAVKPKHIVFNVDELLEQKPGSRAKWLKKHTESDFKGKIATELKLSNTPEDVMAALGRRLSPRTPRLLPAGALYLQPGEERRRSGSHYTPRELTEPIVRTTLRPVLENLGDKPTPEQILDLKVCDPAMGSGAFLVEACRQLAEKLVEAWAAHNRTPELSPDTDPLLHARRLVVQRCLYGVDKNPFAVNLAKLSLWLVTLAQDHAFTFLDHALKCGDSLVGLSKRQIASLDWKMTSTTQIHWVEDRLQKDLEAALGWREKLQALDEGDYLQKKEACAEAEYSLATSRLVGDLVVAAFFGAEKDKSREEIRQSLGVKINAWRSSGDRLELLSHLQDLSRDDKPIRPFHWEVEFPEVFVRDRPGFDVMIGNPPFLRGAGITEILGGSYWDYLQVAFHKRKKAADLCVYFLLRYYGLVRESGTVGIIATKTIAQGDSREIGLLHLAGTTATIYAAQRSRPWPGAATVSVNVVHLYRGDYNGQIEIDGKPVDSISTLLEPGALDVEPIRLAEMKQRALQGSCPVGTGFLLDSAEAVDLIKKNPVLSDYIAPYLTGKDFNSRTMHDPSRWAINTKEMSLEEVRQLPGIYDILHERVFPERQKQDAKKYPRMVEQWWKYWHPRLEVYEMAKRRSRLLVRSRVCDKHIVGFVPTTYVYSDIVVVFDVEDWATFSVIQSLVHEVWLRRYASTMRTDTRYVPTRCWETFPLPRPNDEIVEQLSRAGEEFHDFRDRLCQEQGIGYTPLYTQFHNPEVRSPEIVRMRELHSALDRAVLDAYGWIDIEPIYGFHLDYEIDEDNWGNKKKPYRYRWTDEIQLQVLVRLLELNQQRAEEERQAGLTAGKAKKKTTRKKGVKKSKKSSSMSLFGDK